MLLLSRCRRTIKPLAKLLHHCDLDIRLLAGETIGLLVEFERDLVADEERVPSPSSLIDTNFLLPCPYFGNIYSRGRRSRSTCRSWTARASQ